MIKPTELFQKLNDIIIDTYTFKSKTLKEDRLNTKCSNVQFLLNGQLLVYKFDALAIFPYFENGSQNALSDYFIISPDDSDNSLFIFICNLKSSKTSNTHDQVHAGYVFAKFLLETVCRLLKLNGIPDFVRFRAIHLGIGSDFTKGSINPRKLVYKSYSNGLPYIFSSCQNTLNLNHLKKIPIS
ncbi:hypothetical protein QM480_01565 [Flectobacillus sp. DC10W]|uniref:Uncharacterized protein n=1 Tax=Flectobacillus longus TaxID=2984207 RepID=A0ABT6YHC3_9BACT|nr:hypothetical protein [Flectobacillus longus]MDI9862996.1 hypothetical protein [Flectobacillus longus]